MTVQAPIRIHVMGVSGSTDDRGRNKWLERWWGEHNYQLGLAGNDEASGTNLPCTLAHAQERKSVFCLVSVLLRCPPLWQSPVFASHLSSRFSLCVCVCDWSVHNIFVCVYCCHRLSSPQYAYFTWTNTESQARERQKWVRAFSWSPVFLIILSALSCLVLPPPVKSASIYVTRIKDYSDANVFYRDLCM